MECAEFDVVGTIHYNINTQNTRLNTCKYVTVETKTVLSALTFKTCHGQVKLMG